MQAEFWGGCGISLGMWDTFDPVDLPRKIVKAEPCAEETDAALFAQLRLGFEPDKKQMLVLRSKSNRVILNCCRQWGKSTVTAAKAVHRAYTRPGSLVLVASPSGRQSAEFLRKAKGFLRKLRIRPRGDGENAISLRFPNESRIVGLPGKEAKVRGFSAVSLILIDEASRVPDELYLALHPMLAVGDGDLWLMSTPCGKRGFFYEAWKDEGTDWFRVSAKATECGRISKKFLDQERKAMGSSYFSQEYLCEFTSDDLAYFDREMIEAAIDNSIPELRIDQGW